MQTRTHTRAQRMKTDNRLWEALERRDLLAAHLIADYFPLDNSTTWNYSGTVNGVAATAIASLSAGATISGVPTTKLTTVFSPGLGGTPTTDTRSYAHTTTGLRMLREEVVQGSVTSTTLFGDGIAFLTPSVNDGAVIHFTRSFTGTGLDSRAWSGSMSGDMRVVGLETIDTSGGSYEALKITLNETFSETGSTGWTATGTVAETRWLVRGIGTVRVDYASSLASSDQEDSSFRFNLGLKGSNRLGDLAGMTVTGKGVVVAYGDTSPGAADGTNYTGIDINGGTKTRIFKVYNTSTSPITLSPGSQGFITILGANSGEFTVVRQPAQVIMPGQVTLFSVRFDPSTTGFRFATISLATVTGAAHPFQLDIRGTGIFIGAINVFGGSHIAIANNTSTTSAQSGTAFGSVVTTGSTSVTRTFTISNTGVGNLALLSTPRVVIGGAAASAFTVTTNPAASTAPGGSTTFTITFDPTATGAQAATVSILSNDRFNVYFTFAITGIGL